MKASRRGLCAVLVFSLALLLQGCSGRAPETAEPRETVTLSALQYELENIAVDFNALSYYDRIAEQTGVRVDFEDVKDSEWTSGVSLTFARGDLPWTLRNTACPAICCYRWRGIWSRGSCRITRSGWRKAA